MTKQAVVIQHIAVETLGNNFRAVLENAGFHLTTVPVFDGAPEFGEFNAPELADVSLIISLGGPMSANDHYPALRREMEYLRVATIGNPATPVMGICLGAQLLARSLGGVVAPTGGYQFGLRKIDITAEGICNPVFGEIKTPLVPTLHGEYFSVPPGATLLAEGTMLRRDGGFKRIPMAFCSGLSFGFQFEPQLTLEELQIWNRVLYQDYELMGDRFDPEEESARNLREFTAFAPSHEVQMSRMLRAFLENAGFGTD